jgi:hypothetical protein
MERGQYHNSGKEHAARVVAFLNVQFFSVLYDQFSVLYDQFKGNVLPSSRLSDGK